MPNYFRCLAVDAAKEIGIDLLDSPTWDNPRSQWFIEEDNCEAGYYRFILIYFDEERHAHYLSSPDNNLTESLPVIKAPYLREWPPNEATEKAFKEEIKRQILSYKPETIREGS